MIFQPIIDKMMQNPKQLFLIDAFGALISAFSLGVILVKFENIFGMPRNALYFLAFLPCLFAIYDFGYYFRFTENWRPFLKGIAIANLLYCCLSIGFVVHHYAELTNLGFIYFFLELIIVLSLVSIELKTATK